MIKLQLKGNALKDQDGQPVVESGTVIDLASIVSGALLYSQDGDAIKKYDLGLRVRNDEVVEVDTSDFDVLYEAVKEAKNLVVLSKGQVLKALKGMKDAAE